MKRVFSLAIAAVAGQLVAGTYTWTGGAEDNNWTSSGNWSYNGEPAANAPANNFPASDSVMINGNYTVNYDGGGDPNFSGTLTVTGGATWRQGCNAWPKIPGKIIVDGGSFYSGDNQGCHGDGYGHIEVRNGGLFKIDRSLSNGFIYQSMLVESNGRVEVFGNNLTLKAADNVKTSGIVYCDQDIIVPAGVMPGEGSIISTNASKGLLKPQNGAVFKNTAWECRVIHPDSGSVTTLRSGSLRLDSDWSNGFEQEGGAYLDYVTGSAFTLYIRSFTSDVYEKTFGSDTTNPKFRLNGEVVSAVDFVTKFTVADTGDGFVSIVLNNSATSALFNESSVELGTSDSSVYVSATFERTGEPAATVYLAYDTEDKGSSFSAWQNKIEVGAASAEGFDRELVTGVTPKADLVFRLFVGTAEEFDVSDSTAFYTRYYGEDLRGKTVCEWIGGGGDTKFSTAANWLKGAKPTKNGDWYADNIVIDTEAVVDYDAGGDIRPYAGLIVKITGGGSLVQSTGNWPDMYGRLILDNGTFDCTSAGQFRLRTNGEVAISNGGALRYKDMETRDTDTVFSISNGSVSATGRFQAFSGDKFAGGSIATSGNFQYRDGTLIDGTAVTAAKIAALDSGAIITFQSGSLTITGTGDGGFANNGGYINVTADSTASFTFPFSRSDVEANVLSKFRLNGIEITELDEDVWQVVETTEGNVTTTTFTHKAVSGTLPLIENPTVSLGATETSASVTATLSAGAPLTSLKVKYGTSKSALSEEIAYEGTVEGIEDGDTISFALSGLVSHKKYYYQIVAVNEVGETATLCTDATSFITFIPSASSAVWTGAQDGAANNPANWLGNAVPSETSDVMIADAYAERTTITWNLPITIHSWTQESFSGGDIVVNFETTTNSSLTVSGDVNLLGGTWAHQGPAAEPSYCINVQVAGNLTVSAAAKIATNQKGYHRAGPGRSVNYGTMEDGVDDNNNPVVRQLWTGGAYAGDAGHPTYTGTFTSYGSILNPLDWGSAGKGDTDEKGYSGGGLIILSVGGVLTVNGNIEANGFGWNLNDFAGSSGGTINITAGTISGSGKITANGGSCNCGPGGGGRIRVALTGENATFASFGAPDHIVANSGTLEPTATMTTKRDTMIGAAGTITLVSGGETKVIVADTCTTRREPTTETLISATHLPARQNADSLSALKHTKWELSGHGAIRLTRDVQIASLSLATDDGTQMIYTDGYNLKTAALYINGMRLRGTYTKDNAAWVDGEGSVTVGGSGFVVTIR